MLVVLLHVAKLCSGSAKYRIDPYNYVERAGYKDILVLGLPEEYRLSFHCSPNLIPQIPR